MSCDYLWITNEYLDDQNDGWMNECMDNWMYIRHGAKAFRK